MIVCSGTCVVLFPLKLGVSFVVSVTSVSLTSNNQNLNYLSKVELAGHLLAFARHCFFFKDLFPITSGYL